MAEYFSLLSRAVGRLQPNTESSRREIYVKARNALIQQLKAITPPLSASEISKQRLELEEAIRKVERENATAVRAPTEAEISQSAARAMEEALGGPAEPAPARAAPMAAAAATARPAFADTPPPIPRGEMTARAMPTPARPPANDQPAAARAEQPVLRAAPAPPEPERKSEEAVTVVTPAGPSVRPIPARPIPARVARPAPIPARPVPMPMAAPPAEEARPAMDEEEANELADGERRRFRGRGRGEARAARPRRSLLSRLIVLVMILGVLAALAFAAWTFRDEIKDFFSSLLDGNPTTAGTTDATDGADTAAAADGVRQVGPQPLDAGVNTPVGPAVVTPAQAILYEEIADTAGPMPNFEASIAWSLVQDATLGTVLAAEITVPGRNLTLNLTMFENNDATLPYAYVVRVIAQVPGNFPGGGIREVANLALKTTEEAIGDPLPGTTRSDPPSLFEIQLARDTAQQSINRLRSRDWFDLGFVYANGQRAILTFEKGSVGGRVVNDAIAAWNAN